MNVKRIYFLLSGFAIVIFIYLAVIGLRYVVTTKLDCRLCRGMVDLLAAPDGYSAPVAVIDLSGVGQEVFLYPRYVGRYFLEVYPRLDVGEDKFPTLVKCSNGLNVRFLKVSNPGNRDVFSRWGHGTILGTLFFYPSVVDKKNIPSCFLQNDYKVSGKMLISRAYEL